MLFEELECTVLGTGMCFVGMGMCYLGNSILHLQGYQIDLSLELLLPWAICAHVPHQLSAYKKM